MRKEARKYAKQFNTSNILDHEDWQNNGIVEESHFELSDEYKVDDHYVIAEYKGGDEWDYIEKAFEETIEELQENEN